MATSSRAGKAPPKLPGETAGGATVLDNAAEAQDQSTEKTRSRRGRTVSVGAVRQVKYYQLTKHEIDLIREPQEDAARSFSKASFALGLLVNTLVSFSFSPPPASVLKGVWICVGMLSLGATLYYFFDGFRLKGRGTDRLQELKDEHDFT